ncbi:MAG: CRISPR-associated endonuclease Cas1 [Acidobacteriota bacterium]
MNEVKVVIPELIPVRMLNEYVYCPRLAYLEWADGEFAHNAYTIEGRGVHKNVDQGKEPLPEESEEFTRKLRSVTLSSERLGIISRLDVVETAGNSAVPVDYKRGKRPHVPGEVHEPEKVQLCAQGLLLQEHGYECDHGLIYFAGSRERVPVVFTPELIDKTLRVIAELREAVQKEQPPEPLEDSPKCPKCSLLPICLPDEVHWLRYERRPPRPLAPRQETAWPVYVTGWGGWIRKRGGLLEIDRPDGEKCSVRINEISQLVLVGPVNISTGALVDLVGRGIPVTYLSAGGWFLAHTTGTGHHNVQVRMRQHRLASNRRIRLRVARAVVAAKISNQRTLLRRNAAGVSAEVLASLKQLRNRARRADSLETLLGLEGAAAALYFGSFSEFWKGTYAPEFDFQGRNRRPPKDPVNCMLSFAYTLLLRHWTVALSAVGLDPYRGFFHEPRFGRPALALDLMEPYRPLLADSAVITAVNNGEISPEDFIVGSNATAFSERGRKRFLQVFERCMDREFTHPVFGYRISYRRALEVDARLFGRFLNGEFAHVPVWTTR